MVLINGKYFIHGLSIQDIQLDFYQKKASKLVGKYKLKYKYHADWDYMYRMIVHCKLQGIATKNEVFGVFREEVFQVKLNISIIS